MNVAISQKLHWWKRSGQRRRYGDCNLFLCRRRRSGAAQWVESEPGCGILKAYHSSSWWWSDGCHQCPQKPITNSSTTSGFHISPLLALIQKITREEGIITVLGLGFGDLGSRLNLYILLHFFAVINTPHLINLKKNVVKIVNWQK